MKSISRLGFGVIICMVMVTGLWAETMTTSKDQKGVSLTIYNADLALVRDERKILFSAGEQVLAFKEISSGIMPETALIKGAGIDVVEQNFEFDLLSPASLLNKYVGKDVGLVRTNSKTGEDTVLQARVLSTASGVVLRIGNQIETQVDGRLIFPDVPDNLREKPTLTMLLNSDKKGERVFELSYLTRGLSWKADYVAELNQNEDRLDLKGWVTLTNHSGATYEDARLQLVAGDVNRVRQAAPVLMESDGIRMKTMASRSPGVSEESLLEYHLYSVDRPTTVKDRQSKQIALLQENGGVCRKNLELRSRGGQLYWGKSGVIYKKKGVDVFLAFKNDKASYFGLPKPAGIVRVYKKDRAGFSQFVGEDRIDHTPENESVEIRLGQAFDVTADRHQTHFSYISGSDKNHRIYENGFEIKLKNAKDRDVVVKVIEEIPGEWQMLSQSHTHVKQDAATVFWEIPVAAKSSSVLTFRVRTKM